MSLLPTIGAVDQDTGFYNGVATQSARFGVNNVLTNEQDAPSDRKNFTLSMWFKRNRTSTEEALAGGTTDDANYVRFESSGAIRVRQYNTTINLITNAVYRDTSAWYHLVVAWDLDNSSEQNDRVIIYVNGTRQTLATNTLPSNTTTDSNFNVDGGTMHIGAYYSGGVVGYYSGYIADVNFVDGTTLAPTAFGETKNGVWIPKNPTGLTYGNNGFRLQFAQSGVGTASTSTIGADTSGKDRHFTSAGIVASDCAMPDSPENNFCTLNPLNKDSVMTLSEGNLQTGGGNGEGGSTFGVSSGKWYWELRLVDPYASIYWGLHGVHNVITQSVFSGGAGFYALNASGGGLYANGSLVTAKASGWATGDIIGLAYDADNLTLGVYQNNSQIGSNLTVPDAFNFPVYFQNASGGDTSSVLYNFGQDGSFAGGLTGDDIGDETDGNGNGVFKYAPPSGFLALCSANLEEPTIGPNSTTQADNYFGTLTWSGDDGATRKIATDESGVTGTVDFTPDWSWIKRRNGASNGSDHLLLDIVRGVDAFNGLSSNGSSVEGQTEAGSTWVNFGDINNFETGGFTVQKGTDGSHTLEGINQSGGTYVGWNWKAGGSASTIAVDSVSSGVPSIASSVSANTTAGFSIVTYTGTGANATVGHGLGVAPRWIIMKRRNSAQNWVVYHEEIGNDREILLNTSGAQTNSNSVYFNNTSPTTSVFSLGSDNYANASSGTYVAYCFAEVEGYSKFGSYVGNNSDDGPFVYLGFRPAWVMIKSTGAESWYIWDSKRETENPVHQYLMANSENAEDDSSYTQILDFVSNGFKIREDYWSGNGVTYIYMAFAEAPFKYANAR